MQSDHSNTSRSVASVAAVWRTGRRSLLATSLACIAGACASAPPRSPVTVVLPTPAPDTSGYRPTLIAGDVLSVEFPYRPNLNRTLPIGPDGRLTMPGIAGIVAAGRTPEQIETDARAQYAQRAYRPTTLAADARTYLIDVGDRIAIRVRSAPELGATVSVRPDGRVTLPLVKTVFVEGKSPETVAGELRTALAPQLRNPDVTVVVEEFGSRRVYTDGTLQRVGERDMDDVTVTLNTAAPRQVFVAGEVRAPGIVPHQATLTVLDALAAAGGASRTARLDHVVLLRRTGVPEPTATFIDLRPDVRGAGLANIELRPFDILIVPKTRIARVNDFLDQYIYQLIPATRNVNFTYFYDFKSGAR